MKVLHGCVIGIAALTLAGRVFLSAQAPLPSFQSGTDPVVVPTVVTDSHGHAITGLKADDFQLTDDGTVQQLVEFHTERVPISLGLVVDISGSMVDNGLLPERWTDTMDAVELLMR